MRLNVYAEEYDRVERGSKVIDGDRSMYWLRIVMKAHPSMVPPSHRDDDAPAVTFWFDDENAASRFVTTLRVAVNTGISRAL